MDADITYNMVIIRPFGHLPNASLPLQVGMFRFLQFFLSARWRSSSNHFSSWILISS